MPRSRSAVTAGSNAGDRRYHARRGTHRGTRIDREGIDQHDLLDPAAGFLELVGDLPGGKAAVAVTGEAERAGRPGSQHVRQVAVRHLFDGVDAGRFVEIGVDQEDRAGIVQEFGQTEGIEAPTVEVAVAQEQRRPDPVLHPDYELLAGNDTADHDRGKLTDGELRPDLARRDAMTRHLLERQQHLGGLQRIAPELEEVFVDANVAAAEQAMPDFGDLNLQRRVRAGSRAAGCSSTKR